MQGPDFALLVLITRQENAITLRDPNGPHTAEARQLLEIQSGLARFFHEFVDSFKRSLAGLPVETLE